MNQLIVNNFLEWAVRDDRKAPWLFRAGGKIEKAPPPKNETDYTLNELYKMLDVGCIEIIRARRDTRIPYGMVMIVDESGLVRNDKAPIVNPIATWLYGSINQHPIVNTVLLCPEEMID